MIDCDCHGPYGDGFKASWSGSAALSYLLVVLLRTLCARERATAMAEDGCRVLHPVERPPPSPVVAMRAAGAAAYASPPAGVQCERQPIHAKLTSTKKPGWCSSPRLEGGAAGSIFPAGNAAAESPRGACTPHRGPSPGSGTCASSPRPAGTPRIDPNASAGGTIFGYEAGWHEIGQRGTARPAAARSRLARSARGERQAPILAHRPHCKSDLFGVIYNREQMGASSYELAVQQQMADGGARPAGGAPTNEKNWIHETSPRRSVFNPNLESTAHRVIFSSGREVRARLRLVGSVASRCCCTRCCGIGHCARALQSAA